MSTKQLISRSMSHLCLARNSVPTLHSIVSGICQSTPYVGMVHSKEFPPKFVFRLRWWMNRNPSSGPKRRTWCAAPECTRSDRHWIQNLSETSFQSEKKKKDRKPRNAMPYIRSRTIWDPGWFWHFLHCFWSGEFAPKKRNALAWLVEHGSKCWEM